MKRCESMYGIVPDNTREGGEALNVAAGVD